jgi:hypothetical protein
VAPLLRNADRRYNPTPNTEMKKPTEEITDGHRPPLQAESTAIYEVICHSIEIDHLICYRTHRLRLTKAQADAINTNQPESVRFVGV